MKKLFFLLFVFLVPVSVSANMIIPLPLTASSLHPLLFVGICLVEFFIFLFSKVLLRFPLTLKKDTFFVIASANVITSFGGTILLMFLMYFPFFERYFNFPYDWRTGEYSFSHGISNDSLDILIGIFILFVATSIIEWLMYRFYQWLFKSGKGVFQEFSSIQLLFVTVLANFVSYSFLLFSVMYF